MKKNNGTKLGIKQGLKEAKQGKFVKDPRKKSDKSWIKKLKDV